MLSLGAAVAHPGALRVFYSVGEFHQTTSQVSYNFVSLAVLEDLCPFQKNFLEV